MINKQALKKGWDDEEEEEEDDVVDCGGLVSRCWSWFLWWWLGTVSCPGRGECDFTCACACDVVIVVNDKCDEPSFVVVVAVVGVVINFSAIENGRARLEAPFQLLFNDLEDIVGGGGGPLST
jgi:hypothetical protein